MSIDDTAEVNLYLAIAHDVGEEIIRKHNINARETIR